VCAHAVRVAVQKIEGVESVDVSLKRAVADIRLRPGNHVSLEQLGQLVKSNGFTPKEAMVTAVGTLLERSGKPALELGPNVVLLISSDRSEPGAYKQLTDMLGSRKQASLEIVGVVESKTDSPASVAVRSVRAR
jgi:copper chaperone CopZ